MNALLVCCALLISAAGYALDTESMKKAADSYAAQELFDEAIKLYVQCAVHDPRDSQSIFNAALCMLKIGRVDEAITLLEQLSSCLPNSESLRYNIAYAHKTAGNLEKAIPIYEELLAKNPEYAAAELGLGFAYIQQGDFSRGWPQYSKALKRMGKNGEQFRELLRTQSINGKDILLHYEGGLGDTLMFIRYAERIKQLGGNTICMVQEQLIPLLLHCPYIDTLTTYSSNYSGHHDARASLMSMPAIFEDTEATFPVAIPYLYADENLVALWHEKLAHYPGIKIGLCWQSDVFNDSSRLPIARRGTPLTTLEPLLRMHGCTFFSLQRLDGSDQISDLSPDLPIIVYPDLDTDHGCFMDTAALIKNLDLVIAIDSAVAHLAGALGIPTILLLPYATDWRWISNRNDSPWYPHHIIFKQSAPFDWHSVIQAVRLYVESLSHKKKDPS